MYRGKTTITELLELPNRIFVGLLDMINLKLSTEEGKKEIEAKLMENELTGGI